MPSRASAAFLRTLAISEQDETLAPLLLAPPPRPLVCHRLSCNDSGTTPESAMSAVPTLVVILLVGDAWGGTTGLYWAAGLAWVLSTVGNVMMEKHQLRRQEERDGVARRTLEAVEALSPDDVDGGVWADVKRLLRHNPKITMSRLVDERVPVMWCYSQDGTLPASDDDLRRLSMRHHKAILAGHAPLS